MITLATTPYIYLHNNVSTHPREHSFFLPRQHDGRNRAGGQRFLGIEIKYKSEQRNEANKGGGGEDWRRQIVLGKSASDPARSTFEETYVHMYIYIYSVGNESVRCCTGCHFLQERDKGYQRIKTRVPRAGGWLIDLQGTGKQPHFRYPRYICIYVGMECNRYGCEGWYCVHPWTSRKEAAFTITNVTPINRNHNILTSRNRTNNKPLEPIKSSIIMGSSSSK